MSALFAFALIYKQLSCQLRRKQPIFKKIFSVFLKFPQIFPKFPLAEQKIPGSSSLLRKKNRGFCAFWQNFFELVVSNLNRVSKTKQRVFKHGRHRKNHRFDFETLSQKTRGLVFFLPAQEGGRVHLQPPGGSPDAALRLQGLSDEGGLEPLHLGL